MKSPSTPSPSTATLKKALKTIDECLSKLRKHDKLGKLQKVPDKALTDKTVAAVIKELEKAGKYIKSAVKELEA